MKDLPGSNTILLENVLQLLQCPVCWKTSEPQTLIQCRNGHHGCRSCFSRLQTCPLCRVNLTTEIQTFAHETLELIIKELRHIESSTAVLNPETILKIFQCTACHLSSTIGPVLQCPKGHIFCYHCLERSMLCYLCFYQSDCTAPCMSFITRSLLAQKLLSPIGKPCRFSRQGCPAIFQNFSHHEVYCMFYEIYCNVPYCYNKLPLNKLLDHTIQDCARRTQYVVNVDPSKFSPKHVGNFVIPWLADKKLQEQFPPKDGQLVILKLRDKFFGFVYKLQSLAKALLAYTFVFGLPNEAKGFSYTLKLKVDQEGPSIERRGSVISPCGRSFIARLDPGVTIIRFSEIEESLKLDQPRMDYMFEIEVVKNV